MFLGTCFDIVLMIMPRGWAVPSDAIACPIVLLPPDAWPGLYENCFGLLL